GTRRCVVRTHLLRPDTRLLGRGPEHRPAGARAILDTRPPAALTPDDLGGPPDPHRHRPTPALRAPARRSPVDAAAAVSRPLSRRAPAALKAGEARIQPRPASPVARVPMGTPGTPRGTQCPAGPRGRVAPGARIG